MLRLLRLPRAEISLVFVNDRRMRMLNRCHRGVDRTTDVLSFPQYDDEDVQSVIRTMRRHRDVHAPCAIPLGDIVINLHHVYREAAERRVTMDRELTRLLIHGLLHLLGYDHERGRHAREKMQRIARRLFRTLAEDA